MMYYTYHYQVVGPYPMSGISITTNILVHNCSKLFCVPVLAVTFENLKSANCVEYQTLSVVQNQCSAMYPLCQTSTSCGGPHSSPSLAPAEVQRLNRQQLEALKQPTSHHFCNNFSGCQMPRLQVDDEGSKKCRTLCDKPPMIMIPIILVYRYLLCQFLVTLSDAAEQCSCPLAATRN